MIERILGLALGFFLLNTGLQLFVALIYSVYKFTIWTWSGKPLRNWWDYLL